MLKEIRAEEVELATWVCFLQPEVLMELFIMNR
jgi:hypothetical protein